jgi:hypothetical protein
MKLWKLTQTIAMLFAGISVNAFAQTPPTPAHEALLKRVLGEAAKGRCPDDLMSPMLRGTCQQQMPNMGQQISQRGAIRKTEFMGIQASGFGPAEVYRVDFQGSSMMWMINTGPDGKIMTLWSP